jgi:hypothetical protein
VRDDRDVQLMSGPVVTDWLVRASAVSSIREAAGTMSTSTGISAKTTVTLSLSRGQMPPNAR